MSIIWPNRVTVNPTGFQVLFRIIHWVCAIIALYFVFQSLAYAIHARGIINWTKLSQLIFVAIAFWLGGRGVRYMFGRE
ncbi:MAG TPA: hypothetical protein VGH15_14800 [Caulobacteraceae bacterium]|jgi:accessory gene regulator protein AgrB